eukprot:15413615-Alexandrium_andersonii.AAC.1
MLETTACRLLGCFGRHGLFYEWCVLRLALFFVTIAVASGLSAFVNFDIHGGMIDGSLELD